MRFFTPRLIEMCQSDDDRVLSEQERLWEEAGDRYVAYLDRVRPYFPAGLRQIDESYYLHDAVFRGMGRRDGFFVIIIQLDTPPQSILTFTYRVGGRSHDCRGQLVCGIGRERPKRRLAV